MDKDGRTTAGDAARIANISIPTAGQAITRTLPACAVAVIGFPLFASFLPLDAAEQRVPWELLVLFAVLGLIGIIHHLTKAPRPRPDKKILRAQWKRAFSSAVTSKSLPSHPDVRIAAGVAACNVIEGFMVMVTALLGMLVYEFVRPELSWLVPSSGLLGGVIICALRLRRSWTFLHVLHADAQDS